jgi:polar amino acid transport system substrate-binding protein
MGIFRLLCAGLALVAVATGMPIGATGAMAEQLTLVTGEDYPPYVYARAAGGGLAVLLVQQVAMRMGDTAEVETAPWRRGYEETLRGRFDATFPYVRTPERERDFLYSDALFHVRQSVFMPTSRRFAYRGHADLKGRRVCTPLGYAPAPVIQALIDSGEAERVVAPSAATCPGLLAADRADYFIQDLRIGQALVGKAGLAHEIVAVSDPPFGVTDIHFIVPRARADAAGLIARFNAALAQVRTSGDYDRLLMQ